MMPTSLDCKKRALLSKTKRKRNNIDIKTFVLAIRACFKGSTIYILLIQKNEASKTNTKQSMYSPPH